VKVYVLLSGEGDYYGPWLDETEGAFATREQAEARALELGEKNHDTRTVVELDLHDTREDCGCECANCVACDAGKLRRSR
jgi:hypothetical protein